MDEGEPEPEKWKGRIDSLENELLGLVLKGNLEGEQERRV